MKYIERPPSSERLKPYVKCVWTLRRTYSGAGAGEVLWPDGYKEILFHHGRVFRVGGQPLPSSFVMGTLSGYCRLEAEGELVLHGIRLYPWGLSMIVGRPARLFNDRFTPVAEVIGDRWADQSGEAGRKLRELEELERFLATAGIDDARRRLETFLEGWIDPARSDPALFGIIDRLFHRPAEYGVEDAVRDAGLSLRQFERRCVRVTGVPPKRLHKIARFNLVRVRLLQQPDLDLHDVMLEAGYYDYSHFSKDFRQCLGATPAEFRDWARRLTSGDGAEDVEFLQDNRDHAGYDSG
jgi:AraC-like DNA-binding protein